MATGKRSGHNARNIALKRTKKILLLPSCLRKRLKLFAPATPCPGLLDDKHLLPCVKLEASQIDVPFLGQLTCAPLHDERGIGKGRLQRRQAMIARSFHQELEGVDAYVGTHIRTYQV
jgi:hypothetical protein